MFRWFYQRMFESMIGLLGLNMMMMFGARAGVGRATSATSPRPSSEVLMIGDVIVPVDRLSWSSSRLPPSPASICSSATPAPALRMRAAAQDVEIAETQGVDTRRTYKIAFFVAILLAALAGALWGQIYAVSPFLGERPLLMAFIVVILGGMGSIPGAALGGVHPRLHRELRRHASTARRPPPSCRSAS